MKCRTVKVSKAFTVLAAMGAMLLFGWGTGGVARADEQKEPTKEGIEFFEKNIRPVLVDQCYKCHSQEAKEKKKLKAKLYLDSWEGIAKGGESGDPAVVPGDPDKSALIKGIRYKYTGDDEDMNMPPKNKKDGSGGKLPDETIKKFEEWVKMGAPYPKKGEKAQGPAAPDEKSHWAFQPPKEPVVPQVKDPKVAERVQNPIDAFVFSKLEEKGLKPNPPADKRTLIRRVTLDLTGLPPTPAEVDSFLQDHSPDAFSKVVDRLLTSPRYGERWGRHWLDVARYADTKGYVFEEERRYPYAYTYRDWVINAFNSDLPYDQFLIQQIAADKLDLSKDKSGDKAPLAAMGFLTLGRRFLNSTPDIIDDRIDVICRGTMALTVGCARCHDHKFDPIPTKDYYSLYGILDSSTEPKVAELPLLATPEPTPASLAFDKELKAREAAADNYLHEQSAAVLSAASKAESIAQYLLAAQSQAQQAGDAKDDLNRYLLARYRARLQRAGDQDAVLGPWRAYAAIPEGEFAAKSAGVTEKLFGGKPSFNPLVVEAFAGKPPASMREVAQRYGALLARVAGTEKRANADEESLRQVLFGEGAPLNVPAAELARVFKRDARTKYTALLRKVDEWNAESPAAPARAMVLMDSPSPHDSPVLVRGNPANPGPVVPRHFLTVLSHGTPQAFSQGSGRLELAKDIASRDNPLTARVFVNRVWLYHFGKGIVRTPSDFGTRADPPSHPELLDWLALRFMDNGWSVKQLHKLILTSAAYQQSSDDESADGRRLDPDNFLVWHMNRQRLDFEGTRDSLLAVAGTLDETRGGRPVSITDPASTRRTVYGSIDRQNLPALFRAFDFASPDTTSPQRFSTTVPQQALFFMNSPFVVRQAKALAAREDSAPSDPAERIRRTYRLLFAREATADEISTGLQFVEAEAASPSQEAPTWQYGYGRFDEASGRVDFKPLPYFTGSAWQGGPKVPDAKLGWVVVTAGGGHPGNDARHAAVRRWTAPVSGTVSVTGTLDHPAAEGDGVRARVVSSRSGVLGEWIAHHGKAETVLDHVQVQAGDTLDFVVDCRENENSDSFGWSPLLRGTDGSAWSASADFAASASPAAKLSPWEKYMQVLLESNEFVFVD